MSTCKGSLTMEENANAPEGRSQRFRPEEGIPSRLLEIRERLNGTGKPMPARLWAELLQMNDFQISHSTVLAYESPEGTEKIPAGYLAVVCQIFTVNPMWLLMGSGLPLFTTEMEIEEQLNHYMGQVRRSIQHAAYELNQALAYSDNYRQLASDRLGKSGHDAGADAMNSVDAAEGLEELERGKRPDADEPPERGRASG